MFRWCSRYVLVYYCPQVMPGWRRRHSGVEAVEPAEHQGRGCGEVCDQLPRPRRPLRAALRMQVVLSVRMLHSKAFCPAIPRAFLRLQIQPAGGRQAARHARRGHRQEDRDRRAGSAAPQCHVSDDGSHQLRINKLQFKFPIQN